MSHAELTRALWDLSRATGLVATVVLGASIVVGIGSRSGRSLPGFGRLGATQLHRTLALTGVGLIATHVVTLLFDPYAQLKLLDTVLPFTATYRPFWIGLRTCAVDLLAVVVGVALLRHRLHPNAFRITHAGTYVLFPIAVIHGLGSGTDSLTPWSLGIVFTTMMTVMVAVLWRCSEPFAERGFRRTPRHVARSLR